MASLLLVLSRSFQILSSAGRERVGVGRVGVGGFTETVQRAVKPLQIVNASVRQCVNWFPSSGKEGGRTS